MKKVILLAGLLAVSSSGLFAQSPILRTVGDLTTIGGWDFNGGSATGIASVNARYNQALGSPTYFVSGPATNPGNVNYGTAYFTGSNGATFGSNRALNSVVGPAYDLLSTVGLLFANNSLGDQVTNARSLTLSQNNVLDTARATFKVSTSNTLNNFENVQVQYTARNQGAADAFVAFSYSLDGVSFTNLASSSQTWSQAGAFATSNLIDFSSITSLNGQSAIWIGLNYSEAATSGNLLLDNIAIYGTATAIPEPSTYAMILGALCLGVVALRRRKSIVAA